VSSGSQMDGMEGRRALVTGASRGIGAAVASAFAARGARVALLSRSGSDLGLPGALGVACDVRDRDAVFAAVAQAADAFGGLDCAVANAGIGSYGPFLEMDPQRIDAMIDVNLRGTIHTAQAALPHLI
jgi:meso-butanediol dehydrogenase / (S,S)-butanediol dehydrogenase / diacetyl reductase